MRTLEDLIEKTQAEITKKQLLLEKLNSLHKEYEYFKKLKNKRGAYIVAMRKVMAEKLYETGIYTVEEVGIVLSRDHSSILHLFKNIPHSYIIKTVTENMDTWIKDEVFPQSAPAYEASFKGGFRHIINYKLISI